MRECSKHDPLEQTYHVVYGHKVIDLLGGFVLGSSENNPSTSVLANHQILPHLQQLIYKQFLQQQQQQQPQLTQVCVNLFNH